VISFDALAARIGFRHREVPGVKTSRGSTTYSLTRRTTIFVDSMLAYGAGFSSIFLLAALIIGVAGLMALLFAQSVFPFVMLAAAIVGILGIAVLCRYQSLLLEEIRYRPAQVRRIYPDA
jgi:hypothetical protein